MHRLKAQLNNRYERFYIYAFADTMIVVEIEFNHREMLLDHSEAPTIITLKVKQAVSRVITLHRPRLYTDLETRRIYQRE